MAGALAQLFGRKLRSRDVPPHSDVLRGLCAGVSRSAPGLVVSVYSANVRRTWCQRRPATRCSASDSGRGHVILQGDGWRHALERKNAKSVKVALLPSPASGVARSERSQHMRGTADVAPDSDRRLTERFHDVDDGEKQKTIGRPRQRSASNAMTWPPSTCAVVQGRCSEPSIGLAPAVPSWCAAGAMRT
jgi:hypothetical protein